MKKLLTLSAYKTRLRLFGCSAVRLFSCSAKARILAFSLILFSVLAFAKSVPVPEWVKDYRKAFPNSEYIAQKGIGKSADKAKTDAVSALSRYIKSSVKTKTSTAKSFIKDDEEIHEKAVLHNEVNITFESEFYGLEYTEPFYVKAEKKWHCVCFINRQEAWQQYQPQVEVKKSTFAELYQNLEKETDSFTKIKKCKKVLQAGNELLEKLEYARIILPESDNIYKTERSQIAAIPVIYEEAKENCSVYININTDYNKIISTMLSDVFSDTGFNVCKTSKEANYIAEVLIEENITGKAPFAIKPAINLKVVSKKEKSVLSCGVLTKEKVLGYKLESARKKTYPELLFGL